MCSWDLEPKGRMIDNPFNVVNLRNLQSPQGIGEIPRYCDNRSKCPRTVAGIFDSIDE